MIMMYRFKGDYYPILPKHLKNLSKKEQSFIDNNCAIKIFSSWDLKNQIDKKMLKLIKSGKVKKNIPTQIREITHSIISDDLGLQGIVNPADGKKYDSKSQYYKTIKDSGHHIVGNEKQEDAKDRKQRGDFDCSKELSEAIDQTGFLN